MYSSGSQSVGRGASAGRLQQYFNYHILGIPADLSLCSVRIYSVSVLTKVRACF